MLEHLRISRYHWSLDICMQRILQWFYGDNAMSAENQQERLDAQRIVGFVDGEGYVFMLQ